MEIENTIYVLTNSNFMNWIIKKLNAHYYIDDHDNKNNETDEFYSKKLATLYHLISDYAKKNNIEPVKFMENNLYYVEYRGNVFFVYEGNNSFGCFNNTLDKKELPYCINFSDVIMTNINDIVNQDNSLFKDLIQEIVKLHRKGISLDFIKEYINNYLSKLGSNEKSYSYRKERL